MMYDIIIVENLYHDQPTGLMLKLPIQDEYYKYNYLIIETSNNEFIIGRYGILEFNELPDIYHWELNKQPTLYRDTQSLPTVFSIPIMKIKQNASDLVIIDNTCHKPIVHSYSSSKFRCFSGVVSLCYLCYNECDDELQNKLWTREHVINLINMWIIQKYSTSKINLQIIVSNIETLLQLTTEHVTEKPIIRIYGDITTHHYHVPDKEIKEILIELFTHLKIELKLYNISFSYLGYYENLCITIN
jgi:hypothetical protein